MSPSIVKEVKTTCPYCGVGCGVIAQVDELNQVSIKGDPSHPANLGRLCSKGAALGETVSPEGRQLYPEVRGEQCSWEQALAEVAGGFQKAIQKHGPGAVAFYVSGQLLTEDYYVANKLMKGFIGSANIDTNSRLCMSSAVAGYKRAFGSDSVPCSYEDLERAKLIVLVGSNTAWCHPVLFQRIRQAKKANPDLQIIVVDPRRTPTTDIADRHLALRPGTDALLFNGLLNYLDAQDERNPLFTEQHTEGLEAALATARDSAADIPSVADRCALHEEEVSEFYRLFARTERVVTVYSQGINQSSSGSDKNNAIINCHLFTGRIGRPGMGPFSFTGQPNAMGGREVGGLANQLAAHMEIDNPRHRDCVQRFWNAPGIADKEGLKAVDLFEAIDEGRIKAVWIMATNPVVSLPEAERVKSALKRCELVVVSDCMAETDTMALAHIKLPAMTWGERAGTVTNSERRISRQRAFLGAPGIARPDWWIITEVARRMGFAEAFAYTQPAEIFREHAALSGFENGGSRDFDIGVLADIDDLQYDALEPIQWPVNEAARTGTPRLFGDGRFFTATGKARFIAVTPRAPASTTSSDYPFVLNTGRVRDHWHTMTRTGKSPRLASHRIESYVELHPGDAVARDISDGSLVTVSSPLGQVIVRARLSDDQQPGSLFVPMHWNDQFAHHGRIGCLIPANTDPLSGQPESKHAAANVSLYTPAWHGFMFSRRHLTPDEASYWARSRGRGLWRYELAGEQQPQDWAQAARALLCSEAADVGWMEYYDRSARRYRAARFVNDVLESCIFIGPDIHLPPRDWLEKLFNQDRPSDADRSHLLTGEAPSGSADIGRTLCACNGVGEQAILEAIAQQGLDTVEAISEFTRAGTTCGSCLPEIRALLEKK